MVKRTAVLSLVLVALLAAPASAQDEPTDAVSPIATAVAGDDVIEVTGQGCQPDEAVQYSWVHRVYGTRSSPPPVHRASTTADGSGSYSFTITELAEGPYWAISIECGGGGTHLEVDLTSAETTPTTIPAPTTLPTPTTAMTPTTGGTVPSALPRTGTDGTTRLAEIGLASLLIGGVAASAARRFARARSGERT